MFVYVKKMPDFNDSQIVAFRDSVTAYKFEQLNPLLKRRIKTNRKMEDYAFQCRTIKIIWRIDIPLFEVAKFFGRNMQDL